MGVRADGTAESLVVILQDLAPLQELGRVASLPDLARGELAAPGSRVGDSQAQRRNAACVQRAVMPDEDWLVECMNCGACRTMSAVRAARATCNRCCGTLVVDRYSSGRLLACRMYYVRVRPLAGLPSTRTKATWYAKPNRFVGAPPQGDLAAVDLEEPKVALFQTVEPAARRLTGRALGRRPDH